VPAPAAGVETAAKARASPITWAAAAAEVERAEPACRWRRKRPFPTPGPSRVEREETAVRVATGTAGVTERTVQVAAAVGGAESACRRRLMQRSRTRATSPGVRAAGAGLGGSWSPPSIPLLDAQRPPAPAAQVSRPAGRPSPTAARSPAACRATAPRVRARSGSPAVATRRKRRGAGRRLHAGARREHQPLRRARQTVGLGRTDPRQVLGAGIAGPADQVVSPLA